jgi:hypothetical protein
MQTYYQNPFKKIHFIEQGENFVEQKVHSFSLKENFVELKKNFIEQKVHLLQ